MSLLSRCLHCGEGVLPTDAQETVRLIRPTGYEYRHVHAACAARQVIGSVAHIERRCACYVPGADEGDAPGLTRRQAAEAALEAFQRQEEAS